MGEVRPKATLAAIAKQTGVCESDREPRPSTDVLSRRVDASGGAHRAGRPRLRRPCRPPEPAPRLVGLNPPEPTNPIFATFAQVVETALVRHGFTPVLSTLTPDLVDHALAPDRPPGPRAN